MILWWFIVIFLMIVGLIGCVVPMLPGTALVLAGAVLHQIVFPPEASAGWWHIVGITLVAAAGTAAEFFSGAAGAKFFGSSKYGVYGAIAGGLVGIFFALPGIILGPIVGAVAAELLIAKRKAGEAASAGVGTALGGLAGILIRLVTAVGMIAWFFLAVFNQ